MVLFLFLFLFFRPGDTQQTTEKKDMVLWVFLIIDIVFFLGGFSSYVCGCFNFYILGG